MFDLWKYIIQAGAIGYILVGVSVIASGVILERYLFWLRQPKGIRNEPNAKLAAAFMKKDKAAILKSASEIKGLEGDALKVIATNLHCSDDAPLDIAMSEVIESSNQFLWILELGSGIAPMFGILGTVAGIIVSFNGISGDMPDTGVMISGISVSMTTTAIGLIVSLLCIVPFNHLAKMAHKRQVQIAANLQGYWINK